MQPVANLAPIYECDDHFGMLSQTLPSGNATGVDDRRGASGFCEFGPDALHTDTVLALAFTEDERLDPQ